MIKQIYHWVLIQTTAPTTLFLESPFISDPTTDPFSSCVHNQCSTKTKGKKHKA